jgi:hypothetical protein
MRAAETVQTICVQASERERASRRRTRRLFFCLSLFFAGGETLLDTVPASAQPAPAAPPNEPKFETPPVVTGPAAPQPTVQSEAPSEQPAQVGPAPSAPPAPPMIEQKPPPPPPPAEPPPPAPSIFKPALKIGLGFRTGLSLAFKNDTANDNDDLQLALDDGLADQLLLRPYMSAQITDNIGFVGNFEFATAGGIGISVLDAIVQVKIVDEFQIWGGQHIPANDRMNFQGPFFNNSWNFQAPGIPNFPFDRGARDRGFTFWGLVAGGFLKYHLSMVDLQPGQSIENASFAARATFNFLDKENYYYASGTYYGAQDTLAIGGVVRYQKGTGVLDGMTGGRVDNDFLAGAVDLLAEKKFGSAGTFTLQAVYYNLNGTDKGYVVNQGNKDSGIGLVTGFPGQSFLMDVSWLAPSKTGIGQLQPNFHVSYADLDGVTYKYYDVGLGYIIDGFNHKWYLNFRHGDIEGTKEDRLQLGAQFQI